MDASVEDEIAVKDEVSVKHEASVEDEAGVKDEASVEDEAVVKDGASVQDEASIEDEAVVKDEKSVKHEASVEDEAVVNDGASVKREASDEDEAVVRAEASVKHEASGEDEAVVKDEVSIKLEAGVEDEAVVKDKASARNVEGEASVEDEANAAFQGNSLAIDEFPNEVLWAITESLTSTKDRNSLSLVCKRLYEIDRLQRTYLRTGRGLHPVGTSILSLCRRFEQLTTVEITYSGWSSAEGQQIDDDALHTLALECAHLTDLSLSFCGFLGDSGFARLGNSGWKLKSLRLNFIPGITGRGLLSLMSGCQSLSTLLLMRCMQVKSMEWLELVGRKDRLRNLSIKYCKFVAEADLAKFGRGWKRLHEFCYEVDPAQRYMEVFVIKPSQLQEPFSGELRSLSLSNCAATPGQGLVQVLVHSARLERLHLNMCSGVRDEEFRSMKCTQLRSISLHIPSNSHLRAVQMEAAATLTDAGLGVLAQRFVELEEASFTFVEGGIPLYASVSVTGILAMVQWCLSLRVLALDSVYPFTDSCMQVICTSESLHTLQLTLCPQLTDVGIQHIAQSQLQHVSLRRCVNLTDAGFVRLLGLKRLASLRVEGCPAVSEGSVAGLAKHVTHSQEWIYS